MASATVKKKRKENGPKMNWDIFCKGYSKRDVKEKALNDISEQLETTVEEKSQNGYPFVLSLARKFETLQGQNLGNPLMSYMSVSGRFMINCSSSSQ